MPSSLLLWISFSRISTAPASAASVMPSSSLPKMVFPSMSTVPSERVLMPSMPAPLMMFGAAMVPITTSSVSSSSRMLWSFESVTVFPMIVRSVVSSARIPTLLLLMTLFSMIVCDEPAPTWIPLLNPATEKPRISEPVEPAAKMTPSSLLPSDWPSSSMTGVPAQPSWVVASMTTSSVTDGSSVFGSIVQPSGAE